MSFQRGRRMAPSSPAAGIVVTHATPISRTIPQLTWRQRRRPIPIPTIEDETTCVVLTGAPTIDAVRITAAELV
jgi:hypothetical protein